MGDMNLICVCKYKATGKSNLNHHRSKCAVYREFKVSQKLIKDANLLEIEKTKTKKCLYCSVKFSTEKERSKHYSNCTTRKNKYIPSVLTKEFLIKYIITKKFSVYYIHTCILKDKFIGGAAIRSYAKKFNIKLLSISKSNSTDHVKKRRAETCLKKYGAKNALSKNTSAYHKRNETVKERYGVSNVFQLSSVKDKSEKTCLARYGEKRYTNTEEYQKSLSCGKRSKLQVIVEDVLKELDIEFESEVRNLAGSISKLTGKWYSPIVDLFIKNKKTVIEVNGDMWHANPKLYRDTDVIKTWDGYLTAKEIQEKDKARNTQISNAGYTVLILWENSINNNMEGLKEFLCTKLK